MEEQLSRIGLTKTETKIYLALLDLGKSQPGVLSRRTGVHRRSIYDVLDRLIEKGLASYILENGKRFYIASDPKRIQEIIGEHQDLLNQVLPQLEAKFHHSKGKQETLFFRGKEGIKTIFEDQIKEGKDVFIINASHLAKEQLRFYISHYTDKRVKKKIKLYAIYAGTPHQKQVPLAEIRYLPESFSSLVSTNVYGNKAAIILWLTDPVAILIKQPDIAMAFKQYFDLLWKIAKSKN